MPTHARVRAFLENVAKRQTLITYQELTRALQILPPHSIHRVTEALEHLMEEDAAADRPFIAALAISRARGGLPAPGFFDCARRLGRFAGDPEGQDAWSFHAAELNAVFARWGGSLPRPPPSGAPGFRSPDGSNGVAISEEPSLAPGR